MFFFRWLAPLAFLFAGQAACVQHAAAQDDAGARETPVRYFNRQWTFDRVDIGRLASRLQRVGIELPIEMDGEITATLSIGVPWNALRDARAWRAGGRLTSPRLTVEGLTVEDGVLSMQYRDGVLSLSRLQLHLPATNRQAAPGLVTGKADLALVPRGDLNAELTVEALPLDRISDLLEGLPKLTGRLDGKLQASVAVDRFGDVAGWSVAGPVEIEQLASGDWPPVDARLKLALDQGVVAANELSIRTGNLTVAGKGNVALTGENAWSLDLSADAPELSELFALLKSFVEFDALAVASQYVDRGALQATAEIAGTLGGETFDAAGQVRLTDLRIKAPEIVAAQTPLRDIPVEQLDFRYTRTNDAWQVTEIEARAAQGRVAGSAIVPTGDNPLEIDATWSSIRVAELTDDQVRGDGVSSGRFQLIVPLSAIGDLAQWNAEARLNLAEIQYRGTDLSVATGLVTLRDGRLAAGELTGQIEQQQATGSVTMLLRAPWTLEAEFDLPELQLSTLAELPQLASLPQPLQGVVEAEGEVNGSWKSGELEVDGRVAGTDWQIGGHPIASRVSLTGSVGLTAPWPIAVEAELREVQIDRLQTLTQFPEPIAAVAGVVDLTADLRGPLAPLELTGTGQFEATGLAYDELSIERLAGQFELSKDSWRFSSVDAELYSGRVTGGAKIPLVADDQATVDLQWTDLELPRLISDLGVEGTRLEAQVSGELDLEVPASRWDEPDQWTFDLAATIPEIRARRVVAQQLVVEAAGRRGELNYSASGEVFAGDLDVSGEAAIADIFADGNLGEATWTLRDAQLTQVATVLQDDPVVAEQVAGTLDAQWVAGTEDGQWQWQGTASIASLSFRGQRVISELQAQVAGNAASARIQLAGRLAEGQLRGQANWVFAQSQYPQLRIGLRGSDLRQLALLAGDRGDPPIDGNADLELRVRPGAVWRVAGTVAVAGGQLMGLDVRNMRIPLSAEWAPTSGRLDLRLAGVQAALSRGRVTGRLTARRAGVWRLDGDFRFHRVDVGTLLEALGSGSHYAQGRLTGRLTLGGRHVRSLSDVEASLRADLQDTQARTVPVVSKMLLYVPGAAVGSSRFSQGRLEAELRRGVIRLQELSLASSRLQAYLTGQITLAGRLRLDAVVSTGDPVDPGVAEALLSRLVAVAVPPAAVIMAANDLLANRVIHLAIHGTLQRPIVRVKPLETLSREAIRFFLRQATGGLAGGAVATGASGSSR